MIDLRLPLALAAEYHSPSQRARVLTENWLASNAVCPACAKPISRIANNTPGLDFICSKCSLPFELKSKRGTFGSKLVDGAYESMINKIVRGTHSNFFLMNYGDDYTVTDLVLVPKRFIVPEIIERRKPLSGTARRAGWLGCNLRISLLPTAGKIPYVKNRLVIPLEGILQRWMETSFLEGVALSSRGWLIAVMNCIERINQREFSIREVYEFVPHLESLFPRNRHVKEKIRQQLQVLRDRGWLRFLGNGKYERATD